MSISLNNNEYQVSNKNNDDIILELEPILKQFQSHYHLTHVEAFPTGPDFAQHSVDYSQRFGEILEDTTNAEIAKASGNIGIIIVGKLNQMESIEGRAFCMNVAQEMKLNDLILLFEQNKILFLPIILVEESIIEQSPPLFDAATRNAIFTEFFNTMMSSPIEPFAPTVESLQIQLDACKLKLKKTLKKLAKAEFRLIETNSYYSDSSCDSDSSE
jgi:hypothetical protein